MPIVLLVIRGKKLLTVLMLVIISKNLFLSEASNTTRSDPWTLESCKDFVNCRLVALTCHHRVLSTVWLWDPSDDNVLCSLVPLQVFKRFLLGCYCFLHRFHVG